MTTATAKKILESKIAKASAESQSIPYDIDQQNETMDNKDNNKIKTKIKIKSSLSTNQSKRLLNDDKSEDVLYKHKEAIITRQEYYTYS